MAKRISYLRGWTDGLELEESSREGRILSEIIQILDEMSGELRALNARVEETESYVEAVDEDLADLEWFLYDEEDDLYETVDDDEAAAVYDLDDSEDAWVYDRWRDRGEAYETAYEFPCPSCQEIIFLHESTDDEGYHHYVIEPCRDQREPINPT
nr:CD1247 N-terminal domain-containing protein [Brevibacillus sp. SYP-B805]